MDGSNEWRSVGGMYVHGSSWLHDVEGHAVDDEGNTLKAPNPSRNMPSFEDLKFLGGPMVIDQPKGGTKAGSITKGSAETSSLWSAKMDFVPGGSGMQGNKMISYRAESSVDASTSLVSEEKMGSLKKKIVKIDEAVQPSKLSGKPPQGVAAYRPSTKSLDPLDSKGCSKNVPSSVTHSSGNTSGKKKRDDRYLQWYQLRARKRKEKKDSTKMAETTDGDPNTLDSRELARNLPCPTSARSGSGKEKASHVTAKNTISLGSDAKISSGEDSAPKRLRIRTRSCPLNGCHNRVGRLRLHVLNHFPEYFRKQDTHSGDSFQKVLSLRVAALRFIAQSLIGKGADEFGLVSIVNSFWTPGKPCLTENDLEEMKALIVQRNWPRVEPTLVPVNTPAALLHFRPLVFLVNRLTDAQKRALKISLVAYETRPQTLPIPRGSKQDAQSQPQSVSAVPSTEESVCQTMYSPVTKDSKELSESKHQPVQSVPVAKAKEDCKSQSQAVEYATKKPESGQEFQTKEVKQKPKDAGRTMKPEDRPVASAPSGQGSASKTSSSSETQSPQDQVHAPKPDQKQMKWVQHGSLMVLQNKLKKEQKEQPAKKGKVSKQHPQSRSRPIQRIMRVPQDSGPFQQNGPQMMVHGPPNSKQFSQYGPQPNFLNLRNPGPFPQRGPQSFVHGPPNSKQFPQYGPRPFFHAPPNSQPVPPQFQHQPMFNPPQNSGPFPPQNSGPFPQYGQQSTVHPPRNTGPNLQFAPQPVFHGPQNSGPLPQYSPQSTVPPPQNSGPVLQYNPQLAVHTPQNCEPVPQYNPQSVVHSSQNSGPVSQYDPQSAVHTSQNSGSVPQYDPQSAVNSSRNSAPVPQNEPQPVLKVQKDSESEHKSRPQTGKKDSEKSHSQYQSRPKRTRDDSHSPGKSSKLERPLDAKKPKVSETLRKSHPQTRRDQSRPKRTRDDSHSPGKSSKLERPLDAKKPKVSEPLRKSHPQTKMDQSSVEISAAESVSQPALQEEVTLKSENTVPDTADSSAVIEGFDSHYNLDRLRNAVEQSMGHSNPLAPGREPDHAIEVAGGVRNFCDPETFSPLLDQLLMSYDENSFWRYAVGIHPKKASVYTTEQWVLLLQYLSHPRVVALSEVGLDHSVPQNRWIDQELLLHRLLNVGVLGKVLVMHLQGESDDRLGRYVHRTALEILQEKCLVHQRIHVHSFSGNSQMLHEWIDAFPHCYFSIGGRVKTFTPEQREAVREIPSNRLLLETDSPHYAIHPELEYNTPLFLGDVGKLVADIRGESLSMVMASTFENGLRLYK